MDLIGINQDKEQRLFVPGDYVFAKNIYMSGGAIVNEEGNIHCADVTGEVIGHISEGDHIIIFSVLGVDSYIGIFNGSTYALVPDPNNVIRNLGFHREHPITGEYQINYKGDVIIAFRDDINPPRILNIGDLDSPVLKENDLRDTFMFPQYDVASITTTVSENGNLPSGGYYVSYNYENADGTQTDYALISSFIWITDDDVSEGYNQIDGAQTGIPTDKAINVTLTGLDQTYDYVNLTLLYKKNGAFEAKLVKKASIGTPNMTFVLDFFEGETLSVTEVLNQSPTYTVAHTITQLNNRLYLANLKTEKETNLQFVANNINLGWKSRFITIPNNTTTSHKVNSDKSFAHNEVYAFYIQFLNSTGKWTKAYHIPGRTILPHDIAASPYITGEDTIASEPTWKKISTSVVTFSIANETSGDFGYWENDDEFYPIEGGFPTGKVRHHRFPSLNSLVGNNSDNYIKRWDKLSLLIRNVIIPPSLLYVNGVNDTDGKLIKGFRVLYAKRDYNNSTLLGYDISHMNGLPSTPSVPAIGVGVSNAGRESTMVQCLCANASNHWVDGNAFPGSPVIRPQSMISTPNVFTSLRLHCVDAMLDRPSLVNLYVIPILKMQTNTIAWNYWDNVNQTPPCLGFDYVNNGVINSFLFKTSILSTKNNNYIPAYSNVNIDDGYWKILYNHTGETFLSVFSNSGVNINNSIHKMFVDQTFYDGYIGGSGASGIANRPFPLKEEIILLGLHYLRRNCYNTFYSQDLCYTDIDISISDYILNPLTIGTTAEIKGGDMYICDYAYNSLSNTDGGKGGYGQDDLQSARTVHRYLTESSHNINMRYEGFTQNERYFPKSDGNDYLRYMNPRIDFTIFKYDKTYSSGNNLIAAAIHNPNLTEENEFPFRVVRSGITTSEKNKKQYWKQWKANEYYESVRNYGNIENISQFNNNLLIHHEQLLLMTTERLGIETDITKVVLGSGDLFDTTPREIVATQLGYAGTQNQLACIINKMGYCWIDASMGKVFVFTGSEIKEISNEGMRSFFRDNLKLRQTNVSAVQSVIEAICVCDKMVIPKRVFGAFIGGKEAWYDVLLLDRYDDWENGDDYYYIKNDDLGEFNCKFILRTNSKLETDNPYTYKGFTMAYDEKRNRLLLSKVSNEVCVLAETREITNNMIRVVNGYSNGEIYDIIYRYPESLVARFEESIIDITDALSVLTSLLRYDLNEYTTHIVLRFYDLDTDTPFDIVNSGDIFLESTVPGISLVGLNTDPWTVASMPTPNSDALVFENFRNHIATTTIRSVFKDSLDMGILTSGLAIRMHVFTRRRNDYYYNTTTEAWQLGFFNIENTTGIPLELPEFPTTYEGNIWPTPLDIFDPEPINTVGEVIELNRQTQWFNGTTWQDTEAYICNDLFYLPDDLNILGSYNPQDEDFLRCLRPSDTILVNDPSFNYYAKVSI